jgi:hypothetical protein
MNNQIKISGELILHFDINNTIIYYDMMSPRKLEDNIKTELSKILNISKSTREFKSIGENKKEDEISVYDYMDSRTNLNRRGKTVAKHELVSKIIDTQPGVREYYNNLLQILRINSTNIKDVLTPSFQKVLELVRTNPKIKIIFRTFGMDGFKIADHLGIAIIGFLRREIDGNTERISFSYINRNVPSGQAEFQKILEDLGKFTNAKNKKQLQINFNESIGRINKTNYSNKKQGIKNVRESIIELLQSNQIIFVQDHYKYWESKSYSYTAGKPIYPIPNATQIFFDDHHKVNGEPTNGIINTVYNNENNMIQHVNKTNEKDRRSKGIYLFPVTIESVADPDYFIKKIKKVLKIKKEGINNLIAKSSVKKRNTKTNTKTNTKRNTKTNTKTKTLLNLDKYYNSINNNNWLLKEHNIVSLVSKIINTENRRDQLKIEIEQFITNTDLLDKMGYNKLSLYLTEDAKNKLISNGYLTPEIRSILEGVLSKTHTNQITKEEEDTLKLVKISFTKKKNIKFIKPDIERILSNNPKPTPEQYVEELKKTLYRKLYEFMFYLNINLEIDSVINRKLKEKKMNVKPNNSKSKLAYTFTKKFYGSLEKHLQFIATTLGLVEYDFLDTNIKNKVIGAGTTGLVIKTDNDENIFKISKIDSIAKTFTEFVIQCYMNTCPIPQQLIPHALQYIITKDYTFFKMSNFKGDTLYNFLKSESFISLDLPDRQKILIDIIKQIAYILHIYQQYCSFVHLDLILQNILINESLQVSIIDFGTAFIKIKELDMCLFSYFINVNYVSLVYDTLFRNSCDLVILLLNLDIYGIYLLFRKEIPINKIAQEDINNISKIRPYKINKMVCEMGKKYSYIPVSTLHQLMSIILIDNYGPCFGEYSFFTREYNKIQIRNKLRYFAYHNIKREKHLLSELIKYDIMYSRLLSIIEGKRNIKNIKYNQRNEIKILEKKSDIDIDIINIFKASFKKNTNNLNIQLPEIYPVEYREKIRNIFIKKNIISIEDFAMFLKDHKNFNLESVRHFFKNIFKDYFDLDKFTRLYKEYKETYADQLMRKMNDNLQYDRFNQLLDLIK